MSSKKKRLGLILTLNLFVYLVICGAIHNYRQSYRRADLTRTQVISAKLTEDYLSNKRHRMKLSVQSVVDLAKLKQPDVLATQKIVYLAKVDTTAGSAVLSEIHKLIPPPFPQSLLMRDQAFFFYRRKGQFYFTATVRVKNKGTLYVISQRENRLRWKKWLRSIDAELTILESVNNGPNKLLFTTLDQKHQPAFVQNFSMGQPEQTLTLSYEKYFTRSIPLFSHNELKQSLVLSYRIKDFLIIGPLSVYMLMLLIFITCIYALFWFFSPDDETASETTHKIGSKGR